MFHLQFLCFRSEILKSEAAAAPVPSLAGIDASQEDIAAILAAAGADGETQDDEMIARMMQLQFDREHNAMLDREATKYNGTSKGWFVF